MPKHVDYDKILELHNKGLNLREVSAASGYGFGTVKNVLRIYNKAVNGIPCTENDLSDKGSIVSWAETKATAFKVEKSPSAPTVSGGMSEAAKEARRQYYREYRAKKKRERQEAEATTTPSSELPAITTHELKKLNLAEMVGSLGRTDFEILLYKIYCHGYQDGIDFCDTQVPIDEDKTKTFLLHRVLDFFNFDPFNPKMFCSLDPPEVE